MHELANFVAIARMTSREIAELTGKRHDNVMADARKMLIELHGEHRLLSFQETVHRPNPSGGAPIASTVYALPKRETLILVSGYSVPMRARIIDRWQELESGADLIPKTLPDALRLAADLAEQKAVAEAALAIAAPKADALDRIATVGEGSFCLTDAAKLLQMQPKQFTAKLHAIDWIYRRTSVAGWLAYEARIKQGVLEHKVTTGPAADGGEWVSTQVRVTAKGLARLAELLQVRPLALDALSDVDVF